MKRYLLAITLILIGCQTPTETIYQACSVTADSTGTTIICPDGSKSFIANAPNISVVQFCSGTTTYPTSFPEQGLCINNDLYAVYWDGHNAWLTEVAPGHYSSTSSNVPCTFDVLNNCTISH